ncbi:MAG: hypothetical protein WCI57_03745 [Candidatus Berkelbacteria bacterium]
MSILGGIICFAMFCLTLYLIFKPKSDGSGCDSDNSGRNSNQSSKEAMMSRAPIGLLNLNDTVSSPKDTLDQVKQGCDVQTVVTPWSYVKSITHAGSRSSSNNINVIQIDQYFDRGDDCDEYGEVSTRPIVGGKRNNSSRNPEFHKEMPAPKKVVQTPPANPPANQNVNNKKKKEKDKNGQKAGNR